MNFIWEMALKLKQEGIAKEDIFFKQSDSYSPYYEQAFTNINTSEIETAEIEINSLYRFDDIFAQLLSPNLNESKEFKSYLLDIIIHYLLEIDLRHGLSKREYYIRKIEKDVFQGYYGEEAQLLFKGFSQEERFILCDYLLQEFQTGTSVLLFSKVVKAIFPKGIIYKNNVNTKQILIYIGEKKNEKREQLIRFMINTFLPLDFNIRLFWEHHFGIIGVKETMELGDIEIF